MFPNFRALQDFLAFWQQKLEGPLFAVTVSHSIKPAELRAVDGVFRLPLTPGFSNTDWDVGIRDHREVSGYRYS